MTERIDVEVAYARPDSQKIIRLTMPLGTTAIEAVRRSGIVEYYPEIDLDQLKLGIFSKAIKPDTALRARDRVEIYRALIADPKAVRRQRAEAGRTMKKGGGD